MINVKVSDRVAASADAVWDLLRDFGGIQRYSAGIESCSVEGEGGPWYDLEDPNTEVSGGTVLCMAPGGEFRVLRLFYSTVERPRGGRAKVSTKAAVAAAAADQGVSSSDIQQHYAPCGRPLREVEREERVRERLRARLGKQPARAAAA